MNFDFSDDANQFAVLGLGTQMLEEKGYIEEAIDPNLRLIEEINRLKKEKNAVILSHFYVEGALQDIADYVGDSLGLAQAAAKTDADLIVFVGVHFMAETAKIINPGKKVILPDLKASCSLAESAPADKPVSFPLIKPFHGSFHVFTSSDNIVWVFSKRTKTNLCSG